VITAANGKIAPRADCARGVGTKPWRSTEAEAELTDQPANEADFRKAADAALRGAKAAKPKRLQGQTGQALLVQL